MLILNGYHAFDRELLEAYIDLFLAVQVIKMCHHRNINYYHRSISVLRENKRTHFKQVQEKKGNKKRDSRLYYLYRLVKGGL